MLYSLSSISFIGFYYSVVGFMTSVLYLSQCYQGVSFHLNKTVGGNNIHLYLEGLVPHLELISSTNHSKWWRVNSKPQLSFSLYLKNKAPLSTYSIQKRSKLGLQTKWSYHGLLFDRSHGVILSICIL